MRKAVSLVPKYALYFIGKVGYSLNQVCIPLHNKLVYWEQGKEQPAPLYSKVRICPFSLFSKTLKRAKEKVLDASSE